MNDESKSLILIVDDNPQNLHVLGKIIENEGYDVAIAMEGQQALNFIRKEIPDLILLDILMPGMDGYMVCEKIKENPDTSHIPVIFLTALTDSESKVKGFDVGGIDFITKPFQPREVLARVDTHIKLKKQTEELKQVNMTKDLFFSIIAHDLRNAIMNMESIKMIRKKDLESLNNTTQKLIKIFVRAANQVGTLTDNLLKWAQSQRNILDFEPLNVNLLDIIENSLSIFCVKIEDKGITVVNNVPDTLLIYGDKNMIDTVFRNLISNAVKFTGQDGSINLNAEKKECNVVEISVQDSGMGMDADKLSSLFRLTYAKSTIGTNGEKGSGLGLTLCKDFIERNNGTISAHSEAGRGSTFTVTLPAPRE